eukprot:scaffold67192_cov32-Tisochrysis_lutea.AAC.5
MRTPPRSAQLEARKRFRGDCRQLEADRWLDAATLDSRIESYGSSEWCMHIQLCPRLRDKYAEQALHAHRLSLCRLRLVAALRAEVATDSTR